MPSENLDEIIKCTKPTHILTFFIARQEPKLIKNIIDQLAKKNKSISILVSGSNTPDNNINKHNNTFILKEPNDLIKLL